MLHREILVIVCLYIDIGGIPTGLALAAIRISSLTPGSPR
jgi:hypothetical protein